MVSWLGDLRLRRSFDRVMLVVTEPILVLVEKDGNQANFASR